MKNHCYLASESGVNALPCLSTCGEAQFKTLKYRPDFPKEFGSIEAARAYCQRFFTWHNDVHRPCDRGDLDTGPVDGVACPSRDGYALTV